MNIIINTEEQLEIYLNEHPVPQIPGRTHKHKNGDLIKILNPYIVTNRCKNALKISHIRAPSHPYVPTLTANRVNSYKTIRKIYEAIKGAHQY